MIDANNVVVRLWVYFVSCMNGRTVGDIRYVKATPFIVGSVCHLLPTGCWSNSERRSLRYCANKQQWNGLRWMFVERLELTQDEWRKILEAR